MSSFYDFQVADFFARLIQRVSPKSYQQALGEVQVTQKFLENFCGDQVYKFELSQTFVVEKWKHMENITKHYPLGFKNPLILYSFADFKWTWN